MNESTFRFGRDNSLVGTLSTPSAAHRADVAFVLPNAGVIHRVGPHRINVKLARHLARAGLVCLRFDISGVGDSERAGVSHTTHEAQAVDDLRDAMDAIGERVDVCRFVIAGICSGAEHGLAAAVADARVVGLVMVDGYAYPTAKTRWYRYARRLRHGPVATIGGWIRRRAHAIVERLRSDTTVRSIGRSRAVSRNPALQSYAKMLQQLVDRDVQILMIHSGSFLRRYSYAGQFGDAFSGHPFVAKISCEFAPDMDHTITSLASQAALLRLISDWARVTIRPHNEVQSAQPRSRYAASPINS